MDDTFLKTAASMTGYGDVGLLNCKLVEELRQVNYLCMKVGGRLRSRQIIAQIIYQWQKENPDKTAYCSE